MLSSTFVFSPSFDYSSIGIIRIHDRHRRHSRSSSPMFLIATPARSRNFCRKRDQLHEEISALKKKIELAYALAQENEALATEARQDSEANKVYAEQKEEEVKILEISIEELERTVDVLEKKVHEMDEEVQKHRFDRSSLEMEVQALRMRHSTVENFTENLVSVTLYYWLQTIVTAQASPKAMVRFPSGK